MKCEKCKAKNGVECVYYVDREGYLCKSCYEKWVKIVDLILSVSNHELERKYLKWIRE